MKRIMICMMALLPLVMLAQRGVSVVAQPDVLLWELLMVVFGVALLVVEIFLLPGLGVAGFAGGAMIVFGVAFCTVGNDGFSLSSLFTRQEMWSIGWGLVVLLVVVAVLFYLSMRVGAKGWLSSWALGTDQQGYSGTPDGPLVAVGSVGVTVTALRPAGKVRVGDEVYDAVSDGVYIDKDMPVEIRQYKIGQLYVVPLER